ncbi:phosphopentomutase [Alicyclobacillaceae bacterium I2511]|nr:phosphopentomutase [Alicyclobacillaceae bacterium I2511]
MVGKKKRWIWIVLDSVGIGAAPDAHHYGASDVQSHTLRHIAQSVGGLKVPYLAQLGLGCVDEIPGVLCHNPIGGYGKMRERSFGKDTTNGHWEFVGVILDKPLPVYPDGFPEHIIEPFERYVGKSVLCNKPASGTTVIDEFGQVHEQTGRPIVYTSADSVFQVAAHESVVPVETLYDWCHFARELLQGTDGVGRVIARPFVGSIGHYVRTDRRKDFSLNFGETVLNRVEQSGLPVIGIGKISDIYGGSGVTVSLHTSGNEDGVNQLITALERYDQGLIYINLVDFDMLYGHRNNPQGFARAIEAFDQRLPEILQCLGNEDVLCITADHGCDPTTPGTDHTREWVPLLVWRPQMNNGVSLGERATFADIGASVAEFFNVPAPSAGVSFLSLLS